MEKVLFVTKIKDLEYWNKEYTRLYYGMEFCERLLPSKDEMEKVIEFVKQNNAKLTFVTPFVTDKGIEDLEGLFKLLKIKDNKDLEIVINDYGTLVLLKKLNLDCEIILGRLLTKQKRGPRIMNIKNNLPKPAWEHFRKSNVDVPSFLKFLEENNIRRVELDNVLQGIGDNFSNLSVKGSLYYPYAYITVTRLCLLNLKGPTPKIDDCSKDCQRHSFLLENKTMPVPIHLHGNTQFLKNEDLPNDLEEKGFDRIVYQPKAPI
jgi:hypothetical protein